MKQQCVDAVQKVIKRAITAHEVKDIESRLARNLGTLHRKDPDAFLKMTVAERYTEAGKLAAQELVADAAKKRQRIVATILKNNEMQALYDAAPNKLDLIENRLEVHAGGKSGVHSTAGDIRALRERTLSKLADIWELSKKSRMNFIYELWGKDTGDAAAKRAAKAWLDTTEMLRERFNRAGGMIGRLEDWLMPHHHSQYKVAKAGRDKWVSDVAPLLDRSRYFNADGMRMNDREFRLFLESAWQTIATDGINDKTAGQFQGIGQKANRHSESRSIHFADADAYTKYQNMYGERGLFDVLMGHVDSMTRDIGMIENNTPNPDYFMRYWLDKAQTDMTNDDPVHAKKIAARRQKVEKLWRIVSGVRPNVSNQMLADLESAYFSNLHSARLGSAVISSISDLGTMGVIARYNNMPVMRVFMRALKELGGTGSEDARRAGLGFEQAIGSLNRYASDGLGSTATVSGKIAQFSKKTAQWNFKLSLMNWWTSSLQRAYSSVMMDTLGSLTQKFDWNTLHADDKAHLEGAGFTQTDFEIWKLAKLEDWRGVGDKLLTPDAIMAIPDADLHLIGYAGTTPVRLKEQTATRLMAYVLNEQNMAIVQPNARNLRTIEGESPRGSLWGFIRRSFYTFKSFPLAMMGNHFTRGMAMDTRWGSAAYLGSIIAITTILGAMVEQLSQIDKGNNPREMFSWKFALTALSKGGGLGLYSDFLFSDQTQYGRNALESLAGPVYSDIGQLLDMTLGDVQRAARGEETHSGADLVKALKSHLPLGSLFYTRAALDRLIFNNMQEFYSPGYLSRMRSRAKREFGTTYWWRPGEPMPSGAPDLSTAFAQ